MFGLLLTQNSILIFHFSSLKLSFHNSYFYLYFFLNSILFYFFWFQVWVSLTQNFDKVVEPICCVDQNGNMSLSSISFKIFFFLSSFMKLETLKLFSSHFRPLPPPITHKPTNCNSQKPNPLPLFCIHHCTNHQKSNPSTIANPPTLSTSQQILLHIYNEKKKKEIPEKITPQNPQLQAQKAHFSPIKMQITTKIEAL